MEIELTWGTFTSPFAVAISTAVITWFMHRKEKSREAREARREQEKAEQRAKMAEMLTEKEAMKERGLNEWRQRYEKNLCDIKEGIQEVTKTVNNKVDYAECDTRTQRKWDMINHHQHAVDGKVVVG